MKEFFSRIIKLIHAPHNEWVSIVEEEKSISSVRDHFLFPGLLLVVVSIFSVAVFQYCYTVSLAASEQELPWLLRVGEQLFVNVTYVFCCVYVTMLLIYMMMNLYLTKFHEETKSEEGFGLLQCYMLAVYPAFIVWLLDFLLSLMPFLFFLKVVYFLYSLYIIWCALQVLLPRCSDNVERGVLSVSIGIGIFFVAWTVRKLLSFFTKITITGMACGEEVPAGELFLIS